MPSLLMMPSEYTARGKAKQYMFPEGQRLWGSLKKGAAATRPQEEDV